MKGNFVWMFKSPKEAEMFFDRCMQKEAISENDKNEILMQMFKEGLVDCLGHTEMSKDQFTNFLCENMKVLRIEKKKDD